MERFLFQEILLIISLSLSLSLSFLSFYLYLKRVELHSESLVKWADKVFIQI